MGKTEETVQGLSPVDENVRAQAEKRLAGLTKPLGSLGRLEELAITLAGASGKARPSLPKKVVFTGKGPGDEPGRSNSLPGDRNGGGG